MPLPDHFPPDIPLPVGWPYHVRPAVLYVISPAHYAITFARGWAANSINARVGLAVENDRLKRETEPLREEIRIKDVRLAKLDSRRRPYYPPAERRAIRTLKDECTRQIGIGNDGYGSPACEIVGSGCA